MPEPRIASLPVGLVMDRQERDNLIDALGSPRVNPYRDYESFCREIRKIVHSAVIPARLREYVAQRRKQPAEDNPTGLIRNAPIDPVLPVFDYDQPVRAKHALKKTFVAESFLTLYAELAGTPAISYENANDGDVFHDIHPKRELAESQSQKALGPLSFHKDLANHFVRPDYLYMLGLRSGGANNVYTNFASNKDVIARLDAASLAVARQARFRTPLEPPDHPLVSDDWDLRISENRTVGLDRVAERVLGDVVRIIHERKREHDVQPGDFVIVCNNRCVHNKQLGEVVDLDQLKTRWLMKTMNVDSRAPHSRHFVSGVPYMVRSEPGGGAVADPSVQPRS